MQVARKILGPFPQLKKLLRSAYYLLRGEPPISYSKICEALIRKCVSKEDPTILEIGCNDGEHSLWFFEIFKNPIVYCFEPDPRAIARFRAKVGRHPNINLYDIALCDHDGEVEFFQSNGCRNTQDKTWIPEGWDSSGSIRQPKEHRVVHPWVTFDQKLVVTASTLDTWCDKHGIGSIDLIWMDVQGAEIDVFRGGMNALTRTRFVYTEYSNQELYKGQLNLKQLMKYLKDFSVIIRYPGDVFLRNKKLTAAANNTLQPTSRRSAAKGCS
jgi:FkbM family methyltransferase